MNSSKRHIRISGPYFDSNLILLQAPASIIQFKCLEDIMNYFLSLQYEIKENPHPRRILIVKTRMRISVLWILSTTSLDRST